MVELDKSRLRWACRRGMLEIDLFLMPFIEKEYDELSLEEKKDFERFLGESDPDLFAWLMGHQSCEDAAFVVLITKIRAAKHA